MTQDNELTFVEGQILANGGTQLLCDAIENNDWQTIESEIQTNCDPSDRDRLISISQRLLEMLSD